MVVFLFTDIEGSTEKWEKHKDEMKKALICHDAILKEKIEKFGGRVIKHTGDGVFAVFEGGDPLRCALEVQKHLERGDWGPMGELRVRIGLHAGYPEKRGEDYFGPVVNRTARVMAAAWGGQILLTPEVKIVCKVPKNATLQDLGFHMLKDLGEPQQIYGLVHPALALKEFPPLHSLSAHPHNLPSQPTPFIGREEELAEISKLIQNPSCRLLTLIGPGGIGKTRLALQAAAEEIELFHHGIYLVLLAPLTIISAEILVFTIAESLNFTFYSKEDPKVQLFNYLREKEMLLVMDNFEHLLDEAVLLDEILNNSPKVKILVTSRERLNLRGEWLLEVQGMKYPKEEPVDEVEIYSAVQLFLQGARRVQPRFIFSEEEKPYVTRICQLLDGMPLGIELASAWIRVLSLAEVTYEIERNFDFLKTTLRDIPERHRSLRAVFEYSWNLLSEEEQKVFIRMSVFRGGFGRDAVERVAGASLHTLTSLVDKSLLRKAPSGRYEMLDILRLYAEEKLNQNPEEKENVCNLHSGYYAEFLSKKEEDLEGRKQQEALGEVGEEIENVRAAWRWAVEHGKEEEIGKSLDSLYRFYLMHSWFQEGEETFGRVVERLRGTKKGVIFGKVLARWGVFCRRLSRYGEARELFQKSFEIFSDLGVQKEMAFSLNQLGNIANVLGEYTEAKRLYQESLKIWKEISNKRGIAAAFTNLGNVAYRLGDYAEAKQLYQESLTIEREISDRMGMAGSLNNLGNVAYRLGDYVEAKQLYEECLAIKREIGDRLGIAGSLTNLGEMANELGESTEAKQLFQEGLVIRREIGDRGGIASSLSNLGLVACELREYQESKKYLPEALKTAMEIQTIPVALNVLTVIARLLAKEGQKEQALVILTVVLHHPASERKTKDKVKNFLSELESELSPQAIEAVRKGEKVRKLEEVVEQILGREQGVNSRE